MAEDTEKDKKEEEKEMPAALKEGSEEAGEGGEGGEEGEGSKKISGKKKLIIIAAAVVVLLIGIVAGLYFAGLPPFSKHAEEESAQEETGGKGDKKGKPTIPGAPIVYTLPEILVNLNTGNATGRQTSFLKMKIALKLPSEAEMPIVEANLPVIQDALNTYLRELRASDLSGSAGIYRLREELLLRINKMIAPSKVEDILFQEIQVQ